ncbi:hypothetical protein SAMN05216226_101164 [Halovenus aranensis]|jgi:hypothetical protein|uniref:Uncharacterized protein n=1 Tax=Halovenus aranensis TaxID=890420 RepID=A0A1G8RWT3_9EURY|nr:hypothetical protein [Halovenus aranensis]SDJ21386.1 hypothetical protein SAMN05216226_101164 [Halovenus aranensis]
MTERGQAYSLEGVIGTIVIASALVFGLQAVSIVPWTDGGPQQGIEVQGQAQDTVDILADQNALETGALCLGGDNETTPHDGVVSTDPAVEPVGAVLNRTLRQTANYNVYVGYPNETGAVDEIVLGPELTPTGPAVTVTREVVLFDSDPVFEFNRSAQACVEDTQYENLGDVPDEDIYLYNQNESSDIYAVIQVRVVAW